MNTKQILEELETFSVDHLSTESRLQRLLVLFTELVTEIDNREEMQYRHGELFNKPNKNVVAPALDKLSHCADD